MTLKELLGDQYHDGITIEEIDTALKDKKLADLSTGKYVDKDKYEKSVADLKEKNSAYDELVANTKDYDELKQFKVDAENKATRDAKRNQLKEAGFKDEFLDYGLYMLEQGKIKDDEKLVDNAKTFLKDNKQYGASVEPNPVPPTVNTTLPNGDPGKGQNDLPKVVSSHSWNVR